MFVAKGRPASTQTLAFTPPSSCLCPCCFWPFSVCFFHLLLFFNINPAVRKNTITLALARTSTPLPMSTAPLTFEVAQPPWATADTKPTFLSHRPFYLWFSKYNTLLLSVHLTGSQRAKPSHKINETLCLAPTQALNQGDKSHPHFSNTK